VFRELDAEVEALTQHLLEDEEKPMPSKKARTAAKKAPAKKRARRNGRSEPGSRRR
jgi:hypothetical protein